MRRVISRHSVLRVFLLGFLVVLAFTFIPDAFGQGGFARPGGARHISAPHVNARPVLMQPIFRHHFVYPRAAFRIVPSRRFAFLGVPLLGRGLGLEFSPVWWRSCGPYGWTWGYNCYSVPVYIGEENRELPQLYMKDGTVYNVTDYWVVNNQLHFTTIDESGTKWNEQMVDLSQFDLQKTTDTAKQRGFHFMLRNEPMQQYLQHHPEISAAPASEQLKAPNQSPKQ